MIAQSPATKPPRYQGMRVTREEYIDLADDGYKYDVIEGVMVMSPSADFFHGKTYGEIFSIVRQYLKITPVGYLTQETDVFLPDGGDPLRPDLSFVLNENKHIIKTHIHGVPDLVVEVLSPATEHRDLGIKAERYLKNGVREYWIADPREKTLRLWINRGEGWDKKSGAGIRLTARPHDPQKRRLGLAGSPRFNACSKRAQPRAR